MKNSIGEEYIKITDKEVTLVLHVKKVPAAIRYTFLALVIVSFLIPVFVLSYTAYAGTGLKFGHIIMLFVCAFMIYRLGRGFLWNSYGQEKYTFELKKMYRVYDYKLYQEKVEFEILNNEISFSQGPLTNPDENKFLLKINLPEKEFYTVIGFNQDQLDETIEKLNNFYSIEIK